MDLFTRVGAAVLFLVGGGLTMFGNDEGRFADMGGLFSGIGMPQIPAHTSPAPAETSLEQSPADIGLDAAETAADTSAAAMRDVWGDLSEREDPFAKSTVFPRTPLLRLNTLHHTDKIKRIDLDKYGQYLVTSSYDKTARVWKMPERAGDAPTLLRVLRPPIGPGHLGRIFGVAISPDGALVAVAGWTHWVAGVSEEDEFLYLFDRETGAMVHRFAGLDDIVHDLAFSPDGRFLAAGLSRNGIRVFDMTDKSRVARDKSYGGQVYGLAFAPDGRLATASYDGLVRVYGADLSISTLAPTVTTYTPHGEQPHDLAFSPDGRKIAVGYYDQRQVSLLSATDLTELESPLTDGIENGDLLTVRWSKDGRYLYAGGRWRDEEGRYLIRRWQKDGQGGYEDLAAAGQTILDLHAFGPGGVVYAAADPTVGGFDGSGRARMQHLSQVAGWLEGEQPMLSVSDDGARVVMAYGRGEDRLSIAFDVRLRRLDLEMNDTSSAPDDMADADAEARGDDLSTEELTAPDQTVEVTGWHNAPMPRINGELVYLPSGEWSRSMAISPDGTHVLLGTEKYLRYFDSSGQQLWQAKGPAPAIHVAISGDGRLAVAAYRDGTLRWHRLHDGQELFALYVHNDLKRWVFWAPSGLYDAAPGADDLIGWHINQGDAKEALFYGASRFEDLFHKPDALTAAFNTLAPPEAPAQERILANLPPVVRILGLALGPTGTPYLDYVAESPSRSPIAALRVTVDGRIQELPKDELQQLPDGPYRLTLACEPGDVEVRIAAKTDLSGYGDADAAPLGSLCNFDS